MNLLPGLLIVLCLIAIISAEGHRSRGRQKFKVFKQRRLNPDNLGRRENFQEEFDSPTPTPTPSRTTTITSTGTVPTATGTITTSPASLIITTAPTTATPPVTPTTTIPSTGAVPSGTGTVTGTPTIPTIGEGTGPTSPTRAVTLPIHPYNKDTNNEQLEYDQLINSFNQDDDIDDMIEVHRPRRRKNRRQSSRRHQHRQ